VILAILDDLLFTSKIRGAAGQMGVALTVSRSRDGALQEMRERRPSLVILDLNNPRTDPIGIVTTMRGDADLQAIPTVGYVSHVDSATIEAARQAGIGEVFPRSAFASRLPEILARGR
jgi:PleD family two-component response regulator